MKKNIDIIMASYNGADYIHEQISSMIEVDSFDEKINYLIISDDNSTDKTAEIVNAFESEKIHFSLNSGSNGVIKNFASAFSKSTADYIIISDQDDVWCSDKIDVLYDGIKNIEVDKSTPALFFTDLKVVDKELNIISDSFWSFQKINPYLSDSLLGILLQNVSPGCAMIINKALLSKAQPFPSNILMHDWWLLLVAKTFGTVGFSEQSTFLYRQHDNNVIGAKNMSLYQKVKRFLFDKKSTFDATLLQATNLYELLPDGHDYREQLKEIVNIKRAGLFSRLKIYLSLYRSERGIERNFILFLRIILLKSDK